MASSRAALWAAAVDGGFSKGEAFVSQMPDGKNPENPGFSWALPSDKTNGLFHFTQMNSIPDPSKRVETVVLGWRLVIWLVWGSGGHPVPRREPGQGPTILYFYN